MTSTPTPWQKARRSGGNGGSCVEVRGRDGMIDVRDSKDHGNGPILTFTAEEFGAWLEGCREGEFDHLLPQQ